MSRPGSIFIFNLLALLLPHFTGAQQKTDPLYADSSDYKTWKLSINSGSNDFSPVIYKTGIVFCSDRENDFGIIYFDKESKKRLLDIYYSEQADSFKYAVPLDFSHKINTPYHDGPGCFSADGNTIYFTSNGRKRQRKKLMICVSHFVNGQWSEPEPINLNDKDYSIAHPALSPDGQSLYFVSDQPGGMGGTDIYMSKHIKDDEWSDPLNLGPEVNSAGSEKFPYVAPNGILYFSSDGRGGLGKLDIFSVRIKGDHYQVKNMGYPVNSSADDFGFTCDSTFHKGFFSSNRGGMDDNIYGFYYLGPQFCDCEEVKKENFCYTFFEESSLLDKDTAGLSYEWDFGDGFKAKGMQADHCYSDPGNYFVQLNIIDNKTGVLFFNQASYDFVVEEIKLMSINLPDTVQANTLVNIDAYGTVIPGYTIKRYVWDMGSQEFQRGIKTTYNFTVTGLQKIMLGLIAVNDSTKKQKEFCAMRNVFVQMDKVREPTPIPHSFNIDDTNHKSDTLLNIIPTHDSLSYKVHLGSSKNKIPLTSYVFKGLQHVEEFMDKGVYHYTSGEVKKLINALPYFRTARDLGFDATVVAFDNEKLIPNQDVGLRGTIKDSLTVEGYTIFFEVGQYTLSPDKQTALDGIVQLLKQKPGLKIEIVSHTDNAGDPVYNLRLSEQRANSIKSYLVSKGCMKSKIRTLAYGENKPVTDNETDSGKRANRRADIIIHE
jgi:outer membrane protein OmpA-like peptidoglycan-associated protein